MKKLLSLLLWLGFLGVLLIGGVLAVGYFYLKSDALRTKLEQTISEHTTTPAQIESLGITLNGLTLEGLVIPNEPPLEDSFLQTKSFEVELQWLSLLENTPSIDALRIDSPSLVLHQSAAGGMVLPIKTAGDGTGTQNDTQSGKDLLLQELELKNATIQAFDPEGISLIRIEDLNLKGEVQRKAGDWKLDSLLTARKVLAGPDISSTAVSSPVQMSGKKITLPEMKGSFYEGSLAGDAEVDLNPDDPVFRFKLTGQASDLDLLMQSMGKEAGFMEGTLNFEVSGNGVASAPKDLSGKGNFIISPARMPKLTVARRIGNILGVNLFRDGTFEQVKGVFTLRDQLVDFSELEFISENVRVELTGTIGFDKSLNLGGNVIIEPGATELFAKLFGQTADQIRSESRSIPVTIKGPADEPEIKTDALQIGLDTGKSLLNRFLVKPKDELGGSDSNTPSETSNEEDPVEAVDSIIRGFLGN